MENFPLQTFFLVYAPLQTFCFEILTIFCYTYRFCKQFILSFQALQTIFFNIFHPPPPSKKIMVRPLVKQNIVTRSRS